MASRNEFQVGAAEKIGFPPVLDAGGGVEKCKSDIFPAGKIMNKKTFF